MAGNLFSKLFGAWALPSVLLLFSVVSLTVPQLVDAAPLEKNDNKKTVKIGVLITADTSKSVLAKQAVDAVELVLDRFNESGGANGKRFEAVVKSVDGNWGVGSKQSINLIFEDNVCALLGFVDGRSAHLIEQVSVKAGVPFVSTYSPDPTLSRINIPWFFSTMPRAEQQSRALIKEIYGDKKKRSLIVVSSDDYDRRFLLKSFLRETEFNNIPAPTVITYESGNERFKHIVSAISETESKGIVFLGSPDEWSALHSQLRDDNIKQPLFFPIMELDKAFLSGSSIPMFAFEPKYWNSDRGLEFRKAFYESYGYAPGIYTSYIHDGVIALLEAIRLNGVGNTEIRDGLFNLDIEGIGGRISFDSSGVIKEPPLKIIRFNNLSEQQIN